MRARPTNAVVAPTRDVVRMIGLLAATPLPTAAPLLGRGEDASSAAEGLRQARGTLSVDVRFVIDLR